MKIRTKIVSTFIIVFAVVLAIIFSIDGQVTINRIREKTYAYLESGNRARAEHVRTFIQDQEKTAVILAAAYVYRDFLTTPTTSDQFATVKAKIDARLVRTLAADSLIESTSILDKNGMTLASSDPNEIGKDESDDEYFTEGVKGVFFKDVYVSEEGVRNYAVAAPVLNDAGEVLGVSVLRYSPERFYSIVSNESGLGNTEENFLINHDLYFISPSRFLDESVILQQQISTQNANNCFTPAEVAYVEQNGYIGNEHIGHAAIVQALDYRNVQVVATHAYIPETGWCLITKIDQSYLLQDNYLITRINLGIGIPGLIVFIIIGYFLSRRITKPLEVLRRGVERIDGGDRNFKVKINTQDEVGELSRSFDHMTQSLNESYASVDRKVKEQTKILIEQRGKLVAQQSAMLNILEDAEAEKAKATALASDLEKFKLAVANASDHIVITDPEGIVLYANAAASRITGYSRDEIIGTKAGKKWSYPMPRKFYEKLWRTIKTEKRTFAGELQNRRKDGEIYDALARISPILDEQQNVLFFVGIERDVTHEKQIDRAKTEFVSLASHQLRTPLSAINWYTEMLMNGDAGKVNKEQLEYLQEVYNGSQRMVALVNALLNVSRIDLGTFAIEPTPTKIQDVVTLVVKELQSQIAEKHLSLVQHIDPAIPILPLDPKLMSIILQNLLSNAVKYTPGNGIVTLRISRTAQELIIEVEDTGYGIAKQDQPKIFQKLFRADNARDRVSDDTGLGLYIVKSVLEQSGGSISFTSELGKGTTFRAILPATGMHSNSGTKGLTA